MSSHNALTAFLQLYSTLDTIYEECGASNSKIGPLYPQQYSYNDLMEIAKKVGDLEANIHDALDRWSFNEPRCSHFMSKEQDADEVASHDRIHEQRAILKVGRKAKVGKRGAVEEYIGNRGVMGVEEDEKEKENRKPNAKVGARSRNTNRDASTSRKDGKTASTKRKNKLVDDTRPFKRPKLL